MLFKMTYTISTFRDDASSNISGFSSSYSVVSASILFLLYEDSSDSLRELLLSDLLCIKLLFVDIEGTISY